MNNRSYYALPADHPLGLWTGSRHSDKAPLVVNCAGSFVTAFPFQTDNARGREDYYLMYVLRGTLRVRLAEGERDVGGGTLLIFPPYTPYRYAYAGEGEPLTYLWVHFTGSYAAHDLERLALSPLPLVRDRLPLPRVTEIFEEILDCFAKGGALRDAWLACYLEQLLLTLASSGGETAQEMPLARSLRYIDRHYAEELSIAALAAMEGLSYSRYHDVFAAQLGLSPKRYVVRKRLDHACELLLTTDMSVAQVGAQVGYPDACFFTKIFKKEMGCVPSAYRKRKG